MLLSESKASERAAWLAWQLASGKKLKPADIMESCSVSQATAYRDVMVLSRVLPLAQDDEGRYYLVQLEEVRISPY